VSRFIDEADRSQGILLPETIDEYVSEENPVRVIEAFVGALDLAFLGFHGVQAEVTGRPGYHPGTMPKIYLYGYLNRIQSSRRLEQEARRNLELMWLAGRLAPDFKSPTSDLRIQPPSRMSAASSSCFAAAGTSLPKQRWLSMAASSKR
jgi:transposase